MSARARPRSSAAEARVPTGRHAAADAALAAWHEIKTSLTPVIGTLGFTAVYQRCVELRGIEDPWLAESHRLSRSEDFAALHAALSRRPPAEAEAAQRELLLTFDRQLVSLLGAPLAARVLSSVHLGEP